MKNFVIILGVLFISTIGIRCQNEPIGYLWIEDASYNPDSLVIKKELDTTPPTLQEVPNPEYEYLLNEEGWTVEELEENGIKPTIMEEIDAGEDYLRNKWGQPWVSVPIEGVQGTQQIYISIKEIKNTDGNGDRLFQYLKVRGDGTFEIPLHHNIPMGRYMISLNLKNEGWSKDLNDCFTIIVK